MCQLVKVEKDREIQYLFSCYSFSISKVTGRVHNQP